ncbi:DMT family transporter [Thalassotalea sp. PLHSN55]|uniref:DMT family transporter n=1 Tax=Thalassotalea sp. PLHSN55 TaxID=3435888 RepID=UPI003F872913
MNKITAHGYIVGATLLIAGSFITTTALSGTLHPLSINLMRFLIAACLLAPFIFFKANAAAQIKRVLPRSMVISFFYCGYFVCHFAAMESTTTLNASSLYTLTPFITACLCMIFLKQALSLKLTLVYLLGAIATLWVVFNGDLSALIALSLNQGDLIFLIAVFAMAGYMIAMKVLYKNDDVSVMTFCNLLGGVIWMGAAALLFNIDLNWPALPVEHYAGMAYLAIATTFLTSYLYQKASTILTPVNITAYIYLMPAFVAILAAVFLGETVAPIVWLGIALSVIATVVLQLMFHRK